MATGKNTKRKTNNGGSQSNVQNHGLMALESRVLFSAAALVSDVPEPVNDDAAAIEASLMPGESHSIINPDSMRPIANSFRGCVPTDPCFLRGQTIVDDGAVVVEQSFANSQSDQEPQVSVLDVGALGILGANYDKTNATYADGDLNEDGIVDITDLGILGANWKGTHVQGVIWGQTIDSRGNASENLIEGTERASLGIWTDGTMSSVSEFPAEFSSVTDEGDPRLVVGDVSTTSTKGGAVDHNSARQSWHSLCDFTGVWVNDDGTGQQINDERDDVVNILTTKIPNGTGQQINDDDAQLANVDLQNMLQKMQKTLQMMSNISKSCHDTAMAIIRKIN